MRSFNNLLLAGTFALTACGTIHGGAVQATGTTSTSPFPTGTYLTTVPDTVFSRLGYTFTQPTSAEASVVKISLAQAEQIAITAAPWTGTSPHSAALLHVTNPTTNAPPNNGQLAWVIDVTPPGGTVAPAGPGQVNHWVAFVDASTGAELGYVGHG